MTFAFASTAAVEVIGIDSVKITGSPITETDLNIKSFRIRNLKRLNKTTFSIVGSIEEFPELNLSDGDVIPCRTTIEIELPDGSVWVISNEDLMLYVKDRRYQIVIGD